MTSRIAIRIVNLTKTYGQQPAIAGITLDIERGSRTVVLGHNGAGKSTLLEIIATLRAPTSGSVSIEGFDSTRQARDARRMIGLTPQSNALDPLSTPVEVLDFQGVALGLGRRATTARRDELIELFGLDEYSRMRIARLSGGTRRKVDLAVALVAEPRIVILDEPTSGLDPISRLDFWNELRRLNNDGRTLIVSTQDLHEADVLATSIIVLREGKVAAHDTPRALKQRVGERTLTLELSSSQSAAALVSRAQAAFQLDAQDDHTIRLALTEGSSVMKAAFADLGEFSSDIDTLSLAEPSLDDVFVALAAR